MSRLSDLEAMLEKAKKDITQINRTFKEQSTAMEARQRELLEMGGNGGALSPKIVRESTPDEPRPRVVERVKSENPHLQW